MDELRIGVIGLGCRGRDNLETILGFAGVKVTAVCDVYEAVSYTHLILLGTQMVTKGLDCPDVTLVGVLAADTALNVDDFRANEKCFSLITQVCGRAGRGDIPGRAIIQTYQPQNRTINFAKAQNYIDFYKNEIIYRQRMQYPPFCDLVCVLITGEDEKIAKTEIQNIGEFLKDKGVKLSLIHI